MEYQTRSEENGCQYHQSFEEALNAAEKDKTIWKISFSSGKSRIRLVKNSEGWIYEPIL